MAATLIPTQTTAAETDPSVRPCERPASFWRETLAPYAQASTRRAVIDLATSALPFLLLTVALYSLYSVSVPLMLVLSIPAGGFLIRTFIVFHDCTHGSFLPSRTWNRRVGVFCGLLVYTPFHPWRHEHAIHHATAGDIEARGKGDVDTMTVAEYRALSPLGRLGYRLMRNPLVMLGIGPIWALMIDPRFVPKWARKRFGRHILLTDVVLVTVFGALVALFGWERVLLVHLPSAMIAGAGGIWLFYVQHQFEGVMWDRKPDWNYIDAALQGSSYLKLPKVLQFFTGNIGLHHVHHLHAKIPNYNLQAAHDENEVFHDVPILTGWEGIKALRLKLIDEDSGQLVTFAALRSH
jgi:omega-6 fatty acid desaturase (delta-12 desaturase)